MSQSQRIHPAWIVLGALTLCLLASTGIRAVFGVYIKPMEAEFGWSRGALSMAAALSLPAPVVLGLVAGVAATLPDVGILLGVLPTVALTGGLESGRTAVAILAAAMVLQAMEALHVRHWVDRWGVEVGPSVVWIVVLVGYTLHGVGMAFFGVAFAVWRGPRFMLAARSEWRAGLFAGAMSIVTYGLALWAYRLGDTPRLAALRETSIVFATLIAIFVLKERVTAARGAGIAVIALGAALLMLN